MPQFNFFGHRAANKLLRPPERLKMSKLFGRVNDLGIHRNSQESIVFSLSYSMEKFRGIGPQEILLRPPKFLLKKCQNSMIQQVFRVLLYSSAVNRRPQIIRDMYFVYVHVS